MKYYKILSFYTTRKSHKLPFPKKFQFNKNKKKIHKYNKQTHISFIATIKLIRNPLTGVK